MIDLHEDYCMRQLFAKERQAVYDSLGEDVVHVYPLFGRKHVITGINCWCSPSMTRDGVMIHNVEN